MLTTRPRLRIAGHGARLRVRTKGDWEGDTVAALRECCRASSAVEKALAEAIRLASGSGMSWEEIAHVLGVAEQAANKGALLDAFAESRRAILEHQLRSST
jgi:hypothetical protein